MSKDRIISIDVARKIAADTLVSFGLDKQASSRGADVLIASDIRGVGSHGLPRLKMYERDIGDGLINIKPNVRITNETASTAAFDCDYGCGITVAPLVMEKAIEMAKNTGIGVAAAKNGNHFGIAGYYSLMAVKEGLIGYSASGSVQLIAPTGGSEQLLGNGPHSWSFPSGKKSPGIMYDMACSTVAGGKIEMAIRSGKQVPIGWIQDENGNDTTDPLDFFENRDPFKGVVTGTLSPLGGPKGYCMTVGVEVLTAIMTGGVTGGSGKGLGYFMMAIDINKFRPFEEYQKDVDTYYQKIKNSRKKPGVEEIFLPGEIEHNFTVKRLQEGVIPVNAVVAQDLTTLAKKYNRLPVNATVDDFFALYEQYETV
jgi:LDH2 family malate/lactate/ureidoglycolate dehydrogenase